MQDLLLNSRGCTRSQMAKRATPNQTTHLNRCSHLELAVTQKLANSRTSLQWRPTGLTHGLLPHAHAFEPVPSNRPLRSDPVWSDRRYQLVGCLCCSQNNGLGRSDPTSPTAPAAVQEQTLALCLSHVVSGRSDWSNPVVN